MSQEGALLIFCLYLLIDLILFILLRLLSFLHVLLHYLGRRKPGIKAGQRNPCPSHFLSYLLIDLILLILLRLLSLLHVLLHYLLFLLRLLL